MQTVADTYGPPSDSFIVEPGSRWAYSHHPTHAAAQLRLNQLADEEPARFAEARVVIADRFALECEQTYLDQPIVEITAERFNDMLDCLPPIAWLVGGGFERFNMREFTHGRITSQMARLGDRYFTRPVRHGDHSTYMSPEILKAALAAGEIQPLAQAEADA